MTSFSSTPASDDGKKASRCVCYRWKVVIHGGIDGFSRMIVFVSASNNNRSETVLRQFQQAVRLFGMPRRIRVDKGGENVGVCSEMERLLGNGRVIRGSSVHNQRIERLWRNVWDNVVNVYHSLFSYMEAMPNDCPKGLGILDIDNLSHMWALHYIYMPRINMDLTNFQKQWNDHSLRTENHSSPNQLFISSMLSNWNHQSAAILCFPQLINRSESERSIVDCPLNAADFAQLQAQISPLSDDGCQGTTLFCEVLQFLAQH
jgi:hypothetical protein